MASLIARRLVKVFSRNTLLGAIVARRQWTFLSGQSRLLPVVSSAQNVMLPRRTDVRCLSSMTFDDWEELQDEFDEAVENMSNFPVENLSTVVQCELFAYYNQAVSGPLLDDLPPNDEISEMMWRAWEGLGDMSEEEAMANYIAVANRLKHGTGVGTDLTQVMDVEKEMIETQRQVAFCVSEEALVVTVENYVQTIRLNRPSKKNALTFEMFNGIADALQSAAEDDDVRVSVITGTGDYYCSGNDLTNFTRIQQAGGLEAFADLARDTLQNFVGAFIDYPKPLVAAVNGSAVGISVTTLGLCDLVFADERAVFHTPFVKLGQSPEGCSSYTFPRIMGPTRAGDLLLLGYKMHAREAMNAKLVTRVFDKRVFQRDYERNVRWLTHLPPQALQQSRNLIRKNDREKLHEVNKTECDLLHKLWMSKECHETVGRFLAKKGVNRSHLIPPPVISDK